MKQRKLIQPKKQDGQHLLSKLRSEHGESLGEVLVAVLVVALGSLLFASMLTASIRIVSKGKKTYHQNMNVKNQLEAYQKGNSGTSSTGSTSNVQTAEGQVTVSGTLHGIDSTTQKDSETSTADPDQQIELQTNNKVSVTTVGSDGKTYRYFMK
ncbi:hypothetical protein ACKX2D_00180 [Lachnospiraceae bacterium YH-ros2226]